MPMPNLSSMSVDALLKLRDDIEEALTRRAAQLRDELSKLGHQFAPKGKLFEEARLKVGKSQSNSAIDQGTRGQEEWYSPPGCWRS